MPFREGVLFASIRVSRTFASIRVFSITVIILCITACPVGCQTYGVIEGTEGAYERLISISILNN